jgi:hypothetical protein
MEISANESAPPRKNQLLAGLAQAMHATAESARLETVEKCRQDATAYVEQMKARTVDDARAIRKASENDIETFRERSKAQMERVRVEAEERIARRTALLEQELAEHDAAVQLEVERVEQQVAAFKDEVTRFFEQLSQGADPTVFANLASHMPSAPDFGLEPEPGEGEPEAAASAPASQEPAAPAARMPLYPGNLSGAGTVRGRLVAEWYPEVERLKEIGEEKAAITLLLDMVYGTEAESQADGVPVASRPYEELANIRRDHGEFESEMSILERFSRQQYAPGPMSQRLLERLAGLKKSRR